MTKEILNIGTVREVTGSSLIAELDVRDNSLYRTYKSRKYAVGQVGSIVKIIVGDGVVFGTVTALRMSRLDDEDEPAGPVPSTKLLHINLFGEGQRIGLAESQFIFTRGVTNYPLPGQPVYLTTGEELEVIYSPPEEESISIGKVAQVGNLPVHIKVDEFLGKHFSILGTTGSGKSCASACILDKILTKFEGAHVILIDPHAEYYPAFSEKAENIDVGSLRLPHWMLNFEESVGLFIGKTEYAATSQSNILKDGILKARSKWAEENGGMPPRTVDSPTPYKLGDLKEAVESDKPSQQSEQESHNKIINKIRILEEDARYEFLLNKDEQVSDNLSDILQHVLRIPVINRPIAIIDLSGVPSEIVDVIVSLLFRVVFDFALWAPRPITAPMLVVCEEAHRYVPRDEQAAFQGAREAIGRVAKEGRKYGVALGLISQRPSELDETILSQCNTIIALRMSNETDQRYVQKALPDAVSQLVDILPAMKTGEGVLVGEGVSVPVRVVFEELASERRPRSSNVSFSTHWSEDKVGKAYVDLVVQNWRSGGQN